MQARIKWIDGAMFVGEAGSGHAVIMDGPPDHGGRNMGIRPMEMVLLGLGGCTSFDVMDILRKARQDVTACETELVAERADAVPAVFERIHVRVRVRGRRLNPKQVARAVALSAEKYCSASIMLEQGGVEITHEHLIEDETPTAAETP
ncbi:MAG: OsmC family protein [Pseudomonadales bacterium]|jgi:putative redox protein|nr:OsmC family protein [Pseudomonadales bacterium]